MAELGGGLYPWHHERECTFRNTILGLCQNCGESARDLGVCSSGTLPSYPASPRPCMWFACCTLMQLFVLHPHERQHMSGYGTWVL